MTDERSKSERANKKRDGNERSRIRMFSTRVDYLPGTETSNSQLSPKSLWTDLIDSLGFSSSTACSSPSVLLLALRMSVSASQSFKSTGFLFFIAVLRPSTWRTFSKDTSVKGVTLGLTSLNQRNVGAIVLLSKQSGENVSKLRSNSKLKAKPFMKVLNFDKGLSYNSMVMSRKTIDTHFSGCTLETMLWEKNLPSLILGEGF